jgi:cyclopropane fatty-acyl-phospholipid synthase-like methyltransferase
VRGLLGHLQTPRGSTILDFGCGPGLSLRVAGPYHLVGCDVSATMRARARANGLATIEPMDLRSHEDSFDGMFASYVFHLVVPEEDLLAAVRCIRRGGRIAINFHKGCGLKEVESAMTQDEGLRELAVSPREHPIHGSIRVWQRGQ